MGLVLGGHLSVGGGSQTIISQVVGIAIEKLFLSQLDSNANDPFGRPVSEVSAAVAEHQATLKDDIQWRDALTSSLTDAELVNYMERVKLYGEEAAIAWLKTKYDTP